MEALVTRVAELEARLAADGDTGRRRQEAAAPRPAPRDHEALLLGEPEDISEELLGWASRAALLPRMASFCFLMVIALALRTITDNHLIDTLAGSALGMGYAAILILASWYLYRTKSQLAPVFSACGAVLMATIVVETHARFLSLPLVPAYMTLMATGAVLTAISYQYTAFLPVSVGTLAMCLAGAAIDYPRPFFPYLSMILLTANLLGFYAAGLKRCSWLRWMVLIVTLVMIQLWSFGLGMASSRHQQPAPELAPGWFLPVLGIFVAMYLALSVLGILRSGSNRVSRFDFSLPAIIAVWAFPIAGYVITARGGSMLALGAAALLLALLHGGIAWGLAGRQINGQPGTNSMITGGVILLFFGLPQVLGSSLYALPFLAATAAGLAVIARAWASGGVRLTAYLLQLAVSSSLCITALAGASQGSALPSTIIIAMLLGCITLYQYRWCRANAPPAGSRFFGQFDPHDLSAATLLVAALANGFIVCRSSVCLFLLDSGASRDNILRCSQSIIINSAAAGLMLYAFVRQNKEIRNIALLVTLVGAIRVFLYDLFGARGVPLVLSVLAFGIAAAVESILLGRWQRTGRQSDTAAPLTAGNGPE
jgi:hypothetical protein